MPKATFVRDYDHRTAQRSIVAYKAGWSGSIPQAHLDAAIAADAVAVSNIQVGEGRAREERS